MGQNSLELYEIWKFIYNPLDSENKIRFPHGYYLNTVTNQYYDFKPGIKHIIGEENEDKIYNRWWLENS